MGRLLAVVAIVAIICLTAVVLVWLERRSTLRRKERAAIGYRLMAQGMALERIEAEVDLQLQTNVAFHDIALIKTILTEHRRDMQSATNKESRP